MEELIKSRFPEVQDLDSVTPEMFQEIMKYYGHKLVSTPAKTWTFGGLERLPDGKFKDEDIATILKDCVDEPAHAFGAHGTPASLRVVDIMGQLQARNVFNVCTLNE